MSRLITDPALADPGIIEAQRVANRLLGAQLAAKWGPASITAAHERAADATAAVAAAGSAVHVDEAAATAAMATATAHAAAANAAVVAAALAEAENTAKRRRSHVDACFNAAAETGNNNKVATLRLLVRPPGLTDDAEWEAKAADFYGKPNMRNNFTRKLEWIASVNIGITDDDLKFGTMCALCHHQGDDEHLESCTRDGTECFRVIAWETTKFDKVRLRTGLKERTQVVIDAREAKTKAHNEKVRLRKEAENSAVTAASSAATAAARVNNAFGFTRKSSDLKEFERCEKACVGHYFHSAIYPELKAKVRISGQLKRRRHDNCRYVLPNPHTLGPELIRNMYGRVQIPRDMRATLYQVMGDNVLYVVAPEIYFPKHFDINKIVCPHCDMIATESSPYEAQGFIADPKVGLGLGSERFYVVSSTYAHMNCGDGSSVSSKVNKFQIADPKVMDQLSPVVSAAYDFVVRRQSLFSRERVMQQDLLKGLGVSAKAYGKMRSEIEEKKKDVYLSARVDMGQL